MLLQETVLHQYYNSILISNNIILGDKLKNTYLCYENTLSLAQLEEILSKIVNSFKSFSKALSKSEKLNKISIYIQDHKKYIRKCVKTIFELDELKSEKNRLNFVIKEKIKSICNDTDNNYLEIQALMIKLENLSVSTKILSDSNEKAQKLINQIESSKAKEQDNFCKNCHKRYKQGDNFNWSCKRHLGL